MNPRCFRAVFATVSAALPLIVSAAGRPIDESALKPLAQQVHPAQRSGLPPRVDNLRDGPATAASVERGAFASQYFAAFDFAPGIAPSARPATGTSAASP